MPEVQEDIISPEEVMAQLRTRGFEDGFQDTPLKEFKGRLDAITGSMRANRDDPSKKRLRVTYNMSELEVIESTEPYQLPVAQISVPHSVRKQSGMGILGASIDKIINADAPADAPPEAVKGHDYLVGKMLHWKRTAGHMMWDGRQSKEVPREAWEILEVEGEDVPVDAPEPVAMTPAKVAPTKVAAKAAPAKATKPSSKASIEKALSLLDGKTVQQWHQVVFNDATVKADGALITQITQRKFLPAMEELGRIEKDENGVYHLNEG